MRIRIRYLIALILLPIMLTGCIVPLWWDDGYYGGRHHHHGGYDGRR